MEDVNLSIDSTAVAKVINFSLGVILLSRVERLTEDGEEGFYVIACASYDFPVDCSP